MKRLSGEKGFTLIEILLVMIIIAILASIIFVAIGNQRERARLNSVFQTAESVQPVAMECYFRLEGVEMPNDATDPDNDICEGSHAPWPSIEIEGCEYNLIPTAIIDYKSRKLAMAIPSPPPPPGPTLSTSYTIECSSINKKIVCGVATDNVGCVVEDM